MKKTKQLLLDTTFGLLYKKGYCATSLTDILERIQLTKGAMYYHFPSKNELVLASMQHYIDQMLDDLWITPLKNSTQPIKTLISQIEHYHASFTDPHHFLDIKHGCPLSNFISDMSDKEQIFFHYFQSSYNRWHNSIKNALQKAQTLKQTQSDFDASQEAMFIIASLKGLVVTAKAHNDITKLTSGCQTLSAYINKL